MSASEPSARQVRPANNGAAREARRLLLSRNNGILSTQSKKLPGYPFGSIAPFCTDADGSPVVLISTIAEHTRNLKADSRASLIVAERMEGDVQAAGRVTLVGDFERVAEPSKRMEERYYRYFPSARDYHKTHNFSFYHMTVKHIRFIGGFGAIHWLEPDEVIAANPFTAEQETSMINHMNEDHVEAMQKYCRQDGINIASNIKPAMVGVDADGFDVLVGETIHRFEFETPADTPTMVRQALVKRAQNASMEG